MLRSIRPRLVLSYVLLTVIAVCLVGALTLTLVSRSLASQEAEYLQANAEAIADQVLPLLSPMQNALAIEQLVTTAAFLTETQVRVLDASGSVVSLSGSPGSPSSAGWLRPPGAPLTHAYKPQASRLPELVFTTPRYRDGAQPGLPAAFPLVALTEAEFVIVERSPSPWGARLRFPAAEESAAGVMPSVESSDVGQRISVPIGSAAAGLGYVELASASSYTTAALSAIRDALVVAGLGSILVAGLFGLVVGGSLTRPLRRLTDVAGQMGAGDLTARADVIGQDEIAALGRQLNQMAADLADSFMALQGERDALRRFIADASHELRTPLTALQNFTELLQGPAGDDAELRNEFLASSADQLARLKWVSAHLLDLSRMDAGLFQLEPETIDARDLVTAAAQSVASLARERDLTLSNALPDSAVHVTVDPARLELAYANLVENAVKYTPTGGLVTVGLSAQADQVTLWVEDNGPGIPAEHLPHVFKRFYRGPDSDASGTGLGLAIARSLAAAHGAEVTLENRASGGLRASLNLPVRAR